MKRKGMILVAALSLFLTGCASEVITVAGTISEESPEPAAYIEIQEFELKEAQVDSERENINCCAVLIPAGYVESTEVPGMYVHEKSPLDSSNIYYSVSEGDEEGVVSEELTEAEYKKIVEEAYKEAGQAITLELEAFEKIDMEGVPAYKIRSSYQIEDGTVQQLAYLIMAEDTYTITYSQMADDTLMADFEITGSEIKLVRNV